MYIAGEDGEILWIAGERSSPHRRCILSSPFLNGGCRAQRVFFDPPYLLLDGTLRLDVSSGAEWKPAAIVPERAKDLARVEAEFRSLLRALQLLEIPDGLGPCIFLLSTLLEGGADPPCPLPMMGRAVDSVLALARSCLRQDLRGCALEGREFAGLGPGLTPSGDDFLGGLFFTVRSLWRAYPEVLPWAEDEVSELLEWAKSRTHPISYVIFRDLLFGHGPEELHDFLARLLLEGNNSESILQAAMRLSRIGHSSGWDLLAGAITGLLMVTEA
jgi:hypothetical protein